MDGKLECFFLPNLYSLAYSLWSYLKIFDQAQNTNALAYLSRVPATNDKKFYIIDELISSNEAKETRGTNAIKHLYDAAIS